MNILLDALPLNNLMTGISRYVRNLYQQLELLEGVNIHYFNGRRCTTKMPKQAEPGPWIKKTGMAWKLPDVAVTGYRSLTWLMFERRVRRLIRQNRFDVYHETAFIPSALNGIPQVFTIHDLSLLKFRHMHPKERVRFSDIFFGRRIKYATHIITVSEFSRTEICAELHLPLENVTAIPEAADPYFFPREKREVGEVMKALGLPQEYLLFVGTLEPRKNLSVLVDALGACKNGIPLVLVGWKGWGGDSWWKKTKEAGIEDRVFATGYVDEESLACLYSGAAAFVFPSLYEGFGLPVLEAMACGCPVICSNVSSLPEVAGDAAMFIDPHDAEGLAECIDRVAADSSVREDLIQKGFTRAAQFSWKKTARRTLDVFRKVSEGRG